MLSRRTLLKNTIFSSTGLIILPHFVFNEEPVQGFVDADELENGFLHPPESSKPQAFWIWVNGHITKNGISLDLQAMKEMGLAGAFIYNTGTRIPKGPVDYGSPEWIEMVIHAMNEARRMDLELYLHNSPGFSSTGAPWVTPEMSMQQLVWSEMMVNSAGSINIQLPQPFKKLNYYRDTFVVAYPTLAAEEELMNNKIIRVELNGKTIDPAILSEQDPASKISFNGSMDSPAELLLEFDVPFEARAITVLRRKEIFQAVFEGEYDNPPSLLLESSEDGIHFQTICTIRMPLLRFMDAPGAQSFPATRAKYFRLSAYQQTSLSRIELHAGPRLNNWPAKVNFADGEVISGNQQPEENLIIDTERVIDLTNFLQPDGHLICNLPEGNWTLLRIGHTCTGAKTAGAPDSSYGLEIDKFSKEAVDFYFGNFLDSLFGKLRPFAGKTFTGVLIDSWEIGKQNWSRNLTSEFNQRRKYGIISWLPALTGRIVKSVQHTEKFLFDIRKTQAELVADNYYGQFRTHCKKYNLKLLAQPNGDGVFDSLQVGKYLHTPMAEFWTRYVPGTLNICKQAVSIAHGYGSKIAGAEAFTGMPLTSRWTEYPFALKSQGDYIFSQGINRFVFHAFVHQPYASGVPGMTFGPYGSHFDRNQTWIKQSNAWIKYLSRSQYLLQQGLYVADICYFKGEEPGSGIPDVNYTDPPTPRILKGDVIGPDVLLNRIKIAKNKIVLPDGMQYSVMILAPMKTISPEILSRLKELVFNGMHLVVTSKPVSTPGLHKEPGATNRIQNLVKELYGELDGQHIIERSFGNGSIFWNKAFAEVLNDLNIKPDFEFTAKNSDAAIHFTHRLAGESDIYFISNHLRRKENIVGSFRFSNKSPEIWNAETGEITRAALYEFRENRVYVPLELEPAGSLFVVFRKKYNEPAFTSVFQNSQELISTKPYPSARQNPYQDIVNNFTIALWVKPDTYAHPSKGVIIFPPEAERVYGAGHAACGLAAGQNGVRVFEREKGPNRDARQMIESTKPLEGWTHVAVRYEQGKPILFINGIPEGKQDGSGKIIHPGLDTPPTDELFSAYFEGNHTKPELYREAMSEEQIQQLYKMGLSLPDLPSAVSVIRNRNGELKAGIFENGDYELKSNRDVKQLHIRDCKVIAVENSWLVEFPAGAGAPSSILLDKLISLHRHENFGVRHFSGTAVYSTTFIFSEKIPNSERKVLLDLGRLEIIAEVKLNGKNQGAIWKEPFRLDVTKTIIAGTNKLEVSVTNLLPNRMIGDEHLSKEDEYDENGLIINFPDWYLQGKSKTGQRITFSAWNTFRKSDPLLESGLLGPVRLMVGVERIIRD